MSRIAVLGGGISGLACAYYLAKFGGSTFKQIFLLESSNRLGGWIHSKKSNDGAIHELGPRSLRGFGKVSAVSLELAEDLGLTDDIIPVLSNHIAAKNRYIYARKQLYVLPSSPWSMLKRSSLLGESLAYRLLKEIYTKPEQLDDDTIHNFMKRRFGSKIADLLVDPFVRGVFAGDCRQLSMKSCLPDVFDHEQEHGSVVRGAVKTEKVPLPDSALVRRSRAEKWSVWSLRNGLGQLSDKLVADLGATDNVNVRIGTPCRGLMFGDNGQVKVKTDDGDIEVDRVVAATNSKRVVHQEHKPHDNDTDETIVHAGSPHHYETPLTSRIASVKRHVLRHYDAEIPPVREIGHPVNVSVAYTLITFHSTDRAAIVAPVQFRGWLHLGWVDSRLRWDTERSGVPDFRLDNDEIWTPDLAIFNNVDKDDSLLTETHVPVMVSSDGHVRLVTPVHFDLMCTHTKRELHECVAKIGSWTYDVHMVDLHLHDNQDHDHEDADININHFVPTVINSRVVATHAERLVRHHDCCPDDQFPLIKFTICVNRVD